MFWAILLLSGSFAFSHNDQTIIAGQDAWTFSLEDGARGDKLEVLAYQDGVNLGKFTLCTVQEGTSCLSKAIPQAKDLGLWAGSVFINEKEAGTFRVYVAEKEGCEIPNWLVITGAKFPCWTLQRIRTQYAEAEVNVEFYRWLMDLPFSKSPLENDSFFPVLEVIEQPDAFLVNGKPAAGVFRLGGYHVIGWDVIEYSLKHETITLPMVLMHELAHRREYLEQTKWNPLFAFSDFGWWHFGHGDFLDPLVKTVNHVKNWFYRRLPSTHSYWPGQVGHEPLKGTPGSFEEGNESAVCIIRPN